MNGIDPYAYMQHVSQTLHQLHAPKEIERVLDNLEYLFEVIDPELQEPAEDLISLLRAKLARASGG